MGKRVLLISINSCASPYPVYPLGVSHIAASIGKQGHSVQILDLNSAPNGISQAVKSFRPDCVGLSLRNIDDVQIDAQNFFAPTLIKTAKAVRECTDVPIVAGGSGYSLFPERLLELSGADFGIWGEGELAFASLLDNLDSGYESIPGLAYRTASGKILLNPKEESALDITDIPIRPAKLVDYYDKTSSMLNIQTQRGCAFKCCYCTYPCIEGTRFRRRSAKNVCDDLQSGIGAGARYFFVVDSVFNTSHSHVRDICEEILRREIKIEWGCFLRPQHITQELMDLMARAGLTHIEFGTDALEDSVMEAYGKGFTFSDVFEASECARKAQVRYAHFLITGGPGETEDTLRVGFENSRRLKKTVLFPFIGMRIYPGTSLYERAIAEGLVDRSTDMLPPRFYVTPHVSQARMTEMLKEFNKESPRWVIGEPPEAMLRIMDGLRKKGVVGPMWEFLAR